MGWILSIKLCPIKGVIFVVIAHTEQIIAHKALNTEGVNKLLNGSIKKLITGQSISQLWKYSTKQLKDTQFHLIL